jgi:VWFA-related protein
LSYRSVVPALAFAFFSIPLVSQVTERIDVSAIEVPVVVRDAKGNLPAGLSPSDFVLLEDGKPQQIIGVSYPVRAIASSTSESNRSAAPDTPTAPEKRWQVVIYVQQSLSSTHALSEALKSLAEHAAELTALGDVQIVGDEGPAPHGIGSATHDAASLHKTLLDLALTIRGQEQVTSLRRQYLTEAVRPLSGVTGSTVRALSTARLEAAIIRARQDAMMIWTARYGEAGRPHALVVITDGYDVDPHDFYAADDTALDADLRALSAAAHQTEIAQAMSAAGWTVLSFAPGWMANASAPRFDVTDSGRSPVKPPDALNFHPLAPLRTLAEETGGSVQTNAMKLTDGFDELAHRLVITYQLRRARDGRAHHIEVKSLRPGISVRAQHTVVSGTPESLSLARATLLATDEGERGELPVRCTMTQLSVSKDGKDITSRMDVVVNLSPIDVVRQSLTEGTLRFSVSVRTADAPPLTISRRMEHLDLSTKGTWSLDFQVHHRPGATVGLVAEELATGAWGGRPCAGLGKNPAVSTNIVADADVPLPESGRWKKLVDAMTEAQAKGALILLDFRSPAMIDTKGDRWIKEAEALPAAARAMEQMVLAVAGVRTNLDSLTDLQPYRGQERHLIVLDPWGGIVLEPDEGFSDPAKFAYALNALRQQTATFIRAATLRREGKIAASLVLWAGGLLDAGAAEAAAGAFQQAYAVAKRDNQIDMMQSAQLGIAALHLRNNLALEGVTTLEEIIAQPASNQIASQAWMLLGHVRREQRSAKQAVAAYQKAYALAPKPSFLADAARRHLETLGSEPESEVRADVAAGNVHLLYPHREVMVGTVTFGVAASGEAARVEMFLDNARVSELTRRPFIAKINLGATPHVRVVRAVAYDAQERRLGEESVTLNDRIVSLGVNIVAPTSDVVVSKTEVDVRPRLPQGTRLAGVDLYWNETKIATMTDAPFRHELVLPSPSASGFIRAVARATDGTSAEDVKMINAGGVSEQVRVDAVQVYAIVQDRAGHYIDGLSASDFVVKEDGRAVTPRVQSAKDDPVSIGLALDTSASMRVAMTDVIEYANEFVLHSLGPSDQTFVTSFDEQPHLVQPLTSNRKQLTDAIYDIQANGGTAIWDAMLYSLQQFHDVPGKRALVVFTDGINNAGSSVAKDVLQYAREVGVPVYVVQIFTGLHRDLQMTWDENSIKNLTESTGGQFFRFAAKNDLPRIFSQIRDDTRGQYLLTYISPSTSPRSELRRIGVEIPRKRLIVRATSGYYPR